VHSATLYGAFSEGRLALYPLTWRLDGLESSGVAKVKFVTLNENRN